VVFDKNRLWTKHINYIEGYVGQRAKIICPVRDISEILASFLSLIHKNENGENFNPIDRKVISSAEPLNDRTRCNFMLDGFLKDALDSLRFPFENNLLDRILIVEYKDLVTSPIDTFNRIYNFLEEDYFDHNFNRIENINLVRDSEYYQFPGLHDVRDKLELQFKDPKKLLPEDILSRCDGLEFWRNFDVYQ
jgi:sulfotransferase